MTENARSRILAGCYAFLVPVARFLLRGGISYREFEEIGRTAFVRVASEEFGIRGRPTNASRVAAMTGIPRKEVRRIRDVIVDYEVTPRTDLSPLGDVLHRWYTDPEFSDSRGIPLQIAVDGVAPSLDALVKRSAGDFPTGAVKVELLRTGAVSEDARGYLTPNRRQAVPVSPDDRLVTSISFNLFALCSTISHNSNPERSGEGWIERFAQSEHIPVELKPVLRASLRKRIASFSDEIDDMFTDIDSASNDSESRIGVGIYYYEDD